MGWGLSAVWEGCSREGWGVHWFRIVHFLERVQVGGACRRGGGFVVDLWWIEEGVELSCVDLNGDWLLGFERELVWTGCRCRLGRGSVQLPRGSRSPADHSTTSFPSDLS